MNNFKSRLFVPQDFCEDNMNISYIPNASNTEHCNNKLDISGLNDIDLFKCRNDSALKLQTYHGELLLHDYNSSDYLLEQNIHDRVNFEPSSKRTCTDLSDINFKINGSNCDTSIILSESCALYPSQILLEGSIASSKLPLLTPDNFLLCSQQKSDSETNLQCSGATYVPKDEVDCLRILQPKSLKCSSDQLGLTENSKQLPVCIRPIPQEDKSFIYNPPLVQNHSNERTNIVPDSSHARRKLVFENEDSSADITDADKKYPKFQCSLHIPGRETLCCNNSYTENHSDYSNLHKTKKDLPPIGVFWDIENCRVPKGLSATHVVQEIRNRFFSGHKEAEFVCVCDTLKENPKILEELNDAQVNIMHVGSTMKNAADDKLLQGMRRFADLHGTGATIILISGDSDFATELYDLRYRKRLHVILIHNAHAQDSLKLSAHETVLFSEVIQEVPLKNVKPKSSQLSRDINVWNLPLFVDAQSVRKRLHYLASNCGGRGIFVRNGTARISFQTPELAARAKKRIEGEDVYGNKVICTFAKEQSSRFKAPGPQEFTPGSLPAVGDCDFLPENNFIPLDPRPRTSLRDRNEHSEMDVNVGMWNKPSGNNFNINGHSSYLQSTWGGQQSPTSQTIHDIGGGSYNSSPILHSSSQGSSRESSPHLLFPKNQDIQNRNSYRICSTMTSKPVQHLSEFRPADVNRTPRISQPWPGSYSKGNWQSPGSSDLQNQSLYSLGNLSLADTSQDSISSTQNPVELQITNLDQHIDAGEMKKILLAWFRERVMVLHVSVFVQSDGSLAATVTVPSQQDAQYAISQLHRKRIGTKRIIISYVTHSQQPPELKRSKVLSLLKEVPGKKLPLFKFRELYEKRFQETIGVSEMYNMRDTITVSDNSTGRMVCLNLEYRNIVLNSLANSSLHDPDELRFCKIHSKGPDKSIGWAERDHSAILPNVSLTLKEVANAIHILLQSHKGTIPLASLVDCYEAEVGPLEENQEGVPLEHLVSCLAGIIIVTGVGGFKHIQRADPKSSDETDEFSRYISPPLVGHLALFSRELVDLLKTFPHCRMTFSRFIPAYHHHFGRQCRVADYGYTKLAELLVSLPHLIQIMGEGNKRIITLAHKAQVKRFSSDLLRVLKSQPAKVISLSAFPDSYEKVMNKPFNVTDYGICDIMDLLREVQETTVILKTEDNCTTIAIPKREQTAEEIERTRLFATEVVELLRHSPQCKMQFNRFIPAYHHHFGRQCRVSDFGFSKLIELFEAIPEVLQIFGGEDEGEKILQLVEKEALRVLGDQIYVLVKNSPKRKIGLTALSTVFTHYYGYSLKPGDYNCNSFKELIGKLRNYVKLDEENEEQNVTLVDRSYINDLWIKSRKILWDVAKCSVSVKEFKQLFNTKFSLPPKMEILKKDLDEFIQVTGDEENDEVKLVPLQSFARDLLILLYEAGGRMLLVNFDTAYLNRFGVACRPATLGFPNLVALVQSLGSMATIKGRGTKRIIVLEKDLNLELPSYCPPPPRNVIKPVKEIDTWSGNSLPVNPVPPPPNYSKANGNPVPPPTPPCDHKFYHPDVLNQHMMMGFTPPAPQSYNQPTSPVIYPGSPVAPNGSVIWGQMWSPQYSVMPPLSPGPHYMMPTIPINWGSVASPALTQTSKPSDEVKSARRNVSPISIQTLDQLGKVSPPNPSELPSPRLFTHNSLKLCLENSHDSLPIEEKSQLSSPTKSGSGPKILNKRLAAQFNGSCNATIN